MPVQDAKHQFYTGSTVVNMTEAHGDGLNHQELYITVEDEAEIIVWLEENELLFDHRLQKLEKEPASTDVGNKSIFDAKVTKTLEELVLAV